MKRKINKIIVHCSASGYGDVDAVDRWHKKRGWKSCGYHYVILNGLREPTSIYNAGEDGLVEIGRELDERGAHCYGQNEDSVGICMIGDQYFSVNQLRELGRLCYRLSIAFNFHCPGHVYPHYMFAPNKTCPNIKEDDLRKVMLAFGNS